MNEPGAAWALVIGTWVILFWGEPDLMSAIIHYLMN